MEDNIQRFMALFSGYTKAYGTYDPRTLGMPGKQKPSYMKVDSLPTSERFEHHLKGNQPIGIYLLDDDEMVSFAAIDIDAYPIDHTKISHQLVKWGLPFVVCNSKSGGAHVYAFFEAAECPGPVIGELRKVSAALGYPDAEIFPKQEKRGENRYGNFINLPFFRHPKLSYSCWDGGQQLGLDAFLDLAESRVTNLAALSTSIAQAGLEPRCMLEPPVKGHTISGRNDFLFRFGCSVQDAVDSEAALLELLQKKNNTATASDHPNFGKAGPLPTNEVERLCKSVIAQKEKEQKSGVKYLVEELNKRHAHVMVGGKARILHIKTDPDHGWDIHEFYQQADFKSHYANRKVHDGKSIKTAGEIWLGHPDRRSYEGITFNPNGASESYYNLFQGFPVKPAHGDCGLYLDHIQNNICKGDEGLYEYVINWMADAIQNPGRRPGVALVIRGKQGVGKGVFVNEFAQLFGPHSIQVAQSSHLVGNFNAHLRDKLLVFADEAFWAGDKRAEGALKALVTEDTMPIEMKGVDVHNAPNFIRLIMASNNDWVVPASVDQRRFVVIEAGTARMQGLPLRQPIK